MGDQFLSPLENELLMTALAAQGSRPEGQAPASEPMDEERAAWLRQAMSEVKTTTEVMLEYLAIVRDSDAPTQRRGVALEEIQFLVENIDVANDFIKSDGVPTILPLLHHAHKDLRVVTLWTLADLCQNNPFGQQFMLDNEILPKHVMPLLEKEEEDEVVAKCLLFVSCFARAFEPAGPVVAAANVIPAVVRCMNTTHVGTMRKATFVLKNLAREHGAHVLTAILDAGSVGVAAAQLTSAPARGDITLEELTVELLLGLLAAAPEQTREMIVAQDLAATAAARVDELRAAPAEDRDTYEQVIKLHLQLATGGRSGGDGQAR